MGALSPWPLVFLAVRQSAGGGGRGAPPAIPDLDRRSGRVPALPYPPPKSGQYKPSSGRIAKKCLPKRPLAGYKYSCPGPVPLAGFEVATYGRFSSGRRGEHPESVVLHARRKA